MARGDVHIAGPNGTLCGEGGHPIWRRGCYECSVIQERGIVVPELGPFSNIQRGTWLLSDAPVDAVDVSVILGTVERTGLVRQCIDAVRASMLGSKLTHEIIVAVGQDADPSVPWLSGESDVRVVIGGMTGAIDAFNRAYAASRGLLVCQINDDVIVEGDSIARAARHLHDHPECAGVVFQFRKKDEMEYRNERIAGGDALHPNQVVARRSTCEAVVQLLGAFWGDTAHRTDKTYGGDSAFGVACHHLGLRLDAVDGVRCHDLEVDDSLRTRNAVAPEHGPNWRKMFLPLMASRAPTAAIDAMARITRIHATDPVDGQFPKSVTPRRERVLHLHLSTPDDPQAGLVRALRGLGDYAQVDWPARNRAIAGPAMEAASWIRPTLVFMQLQTDGIVAPALVERLRPLMAPGGVIATWCGDVAGVNSPWTPEWQVPLGGAVDLTLHSSYTHVKALRDAGIPSAAYLQIGYDEEQYKPDPSEVVEHDVCFLGNRYYSPQYLATMRRDDGPLRDGAIAAMREAFGSLFTVRGSGYAGASHVALRDAHRIYQRSRIGLNVSLCNDFDAYSSDRIFRILGCGALLLTKRFPLMSTYGLVDGVNCATWETPAEAVDAARSLIADPVRLAEVADAGARLARERHTWVARMGELAALLDAARA